MEQLTLFDLEEAKSEIKKELKRTANSFVYIGYQLRRILESGEYIKEGYTDFNEFAKKEFGLGQSATSRFININKKYSLDGFGESLRPEFEEYGSSQLSEMLALEDKDVGLITPDMPVQQIREVKSQLKDEPAQQSFGIPTVNVTEMYLELFKDKVAELRQLLTLEVEPKDVCELLNPSGSRVFKYKTMMLLLHNVEAGVVIRVWGKEPVTITYQQLIEDIRMNVTMEGLKNKETDSLPKENNEIVSEPKEDEPKEPEKEEEMTEPETEEKPIEVQEEKAEENREDKTEEKPEVTKWDATQEAEVEKVEQVEVLDNNAIIAAYRTAVSREVDKLKELWEDNNLREMKRVTRDLLWRLEQIINNE